MKIKQALVLLVSVVIISTLNAKGFDLKNMGVDVKNYDDKTITITRIHDEECRSINGADPKNIWSGNYANEKLPSKCIKKFVTTVGKITPMKITDKIETIGELEVIKFIKEAQTDKNKLLIDARLPDWFLQMSIPTAENIPFT
eukprot:Anaeramoba_ignava/a6642_9.p1 GENE.a6642_9~~a6642_9.p1  ORF type:complete len:143 (-),score=30.71 a6642_9:159-587(-)